MGGDLWAITCLFNPAGYASRVHNYRTFRRHLGLPLVAVELAFDDRAFSLGTGDAERLVQIRDGDRLWQKERLLNLALARLPDSCTRVVWLDCDVIFPDPRWPDDVAAALDAWRMVQVFGDLEDLAPGDDGSDGGESVHVSGAVVREHERGRLPAGFFSRTGGRTAPGSSVTGIGWAFHRDDLAEFGLYDACVMGSGDRAMTCAALGRHDELARALHLNAARRRHYLEWARPFERCMRGRLSWVEGRALHLWHGSFEDRGSGHRSREFAAFDLDPYEDIEIGPSGAWRWASARPEMHAWVARYFEGRREDG